MALLTGHARTPGSYVEIASRAMVRAPLYSAEIGASSGRTSRGAVRRAGIALSIPNLITLGRILLVPIVVWAIAVRRDVDRLRAVPGRRRQRRRRRLSRQALRHDHRTRRLSRSARRQGADRVDLSHPRHQQPDPALAGHPGGVARHPDRRRHHAVVGDRQPAQDQAAAGLQAQHGGADRVRLRGARLARLRLSRPIRSHLSSWAWSRS